MQDKTEYLYCCVMKTKPQIQTVYTIPIKLIFYLYQDFIIKY